MSCEHTGGDKQYWLVELVNGRGFEGGHGDYCNVDGGALVISNGAFPEPRQIVAAWGPAQWAFVAPVDHCPDSGEL